MWGLLLLALAQEAPILRTEVLELIEKPGAVESESQFLVSVPERVGDRHFLVQPDRSVCKGRVAVNGTVLQTEDAANLFRTDRSNLLTISGCLERMPAPVRVVAVPKVFIAAVQVERGNPDTGVKVVIVVRNVLVNSVTCSLEVAGQSQEFLVPAETSQTRSYFVRSDRWRGKSPVAELYKFEEALAGAFRHIVPLPDSP